jgi:acyl-CoA dehydrogenase
MLHFKLSAEQQEIQTTALRFAKEKMRPKATQYDEERTFPSDVLDEAWELGLLNTCIPAEYGGAGFDTITSTTISEALAYGCMGMNTCMMANDLALLPIVLGGTHEQKEKFLKPFTEKNLKASFCLTEPDYGSDAAGCKTTIIVDGDHAVINGRKMWITNAGFADLFVVYGTYDASLGHKGLTAVIVQGQTPGIELGKPEHKMGHRCSDTRAVTFNNVRVPKNQIIGSPGDGWKLAMKTLDHSRPLVASSAIGGAQAALEHALDYSKQRKQFGKFLYEHQAIQFMLAEMGMKIEAGRMLVQKAAWLLDQGQSNTLTASYAKAFAADSLMEIATNAVQIFGGYGYSQEYPVEKIMRDAKLIQIYEGTSQIQRLVMARELLKN